MLIFLRLQFLEIIEDLSLLYIRSKACLHTTFVNNVDDFLDALRTVRLTQVINKTFINLNVTAWILSESLKDVGDKM